MEMMGTNLIATESMNTVDSLIPTDPQISQGNANELMLQCIMADQEDIVTQIDENGYLAVGFKKQADGKYQCMAQLNDGSRCITRGLARDVRSCIKKQHSNKFKALKRNNLVFLPQDKENVYQKARQRMQKRSLEQYSQQGRPGIVEHCMQYTRSHVRCKCATIPLFRVCMKHLNKDDEEKICKNEYLDDNTRTDGGLKSVIQLDGSYKVVTYKAYYFGQAITTFNMKDSSEASANITEGLLEPWALMENRPANLGMGFRMRIDDQQANCQVEHGENNTLIVRCCVKSIEPITHQSDNSSEGAGDDDIEPLELILKSQIQNKLQDFGKEISIKDGYTAWLLGELKHTDRMHAAGTFAQLEAQYTLLVDNQLLQLNQQLLLGRLTT